MGRVLGCQGDEWEFCGRGALFLCEQEGPPLEYLAVASGRCPVPVIVTASPWPPTAGAPFLGGLHS